MVLVPRQFTPDGLAKDDQARGYVQRYPERFVAFIGGQRDDLWPSQAWYSYSASSFLREAETKLKDGSYRGLGEFIIRHYDYNRYVSTTHQSISGEQDLPVLTPVMRKVFELAGEARVPVLIHAEAETGIREQMDKLLREYPGTRVVWAHNCGRGPAENAAAFLAAHPQLMCDLAGMAVPYPSPFGWGMFGVDRGGWEWRPGSHATRVQQNDGTLVPSMKDLFERFPDRFMIGADIAHPPAYHRYGDVIIAFRRMLSQLQPETARKIGYENASRLYFREDPR
jgi:predicted TIM-barrel fold metal-dependent hydrolase